MLATLQMQDILLYFPLFPRIAWSAAGRWCCNTRFWGHSLSSSKVRQWDVKLFGIWEFWWLGKGKSDVARTLKNLSESKFQWRSCLLEKTSCLVWNYGGKFFSVVVSVQGTLQYSMNEQALYIKMPTKCLLLTFLFLAGSQLTTPPSIPSVLCYTAVSWGRLSCFGQMILPLHFEMDFNSHLSKL